MTSYGNLWETLDALLAGFDPDHDPQWQCLAQASALTNEFLGREWAGELLTADNPHEQAICDKLQRWLIVLIETPRLLSPEERYACGKLLARVGNVRPGVGLRADGLPDIVWCEIPAGEVVVKGGLYPWDDPTYGVSDSIWRDPVRAQLPTFWMSKYLVTHLQYQVFLDDPYGFDDAQWWTGFDKADVKPDKMKIARRAVWLSNTPVLSVSWYGAVTYCHWLSDKVGYDVYLPTAHEWLRGHVVAKKLTSRGASATSMGLRMSRKVSLRRCL